MKELILNEEELVNKCLKGDRHAQEFLFNSHYKDLYLISMRYLSDHHDAEDAIILSFTRVFKSLKKFTYQGQGSLGKWIRTILINESIRLLKKRNLLQFSDDVKMMDVLYAGTDGLQKMQVSDIIRLIEKLPPGYRTVFNLYVIEGYSHKEIGGLLGITESTSKTQLKKARHQLMSQLKEEHGYGTI